MRFSDHQNIEEALLERINECKVSYPLPSQKLRVGVDIGANIGGFSVIAHDRFDKIIAIEANKDSVGCMSSVLKERNIENVSVFNYAVSDKKNGKVKLYGLTGDVKNWNHSGNAGTEWGDSTLRERMTEEYDEVETIDLDSVFTLVELDFIDYMKIDCEGAEFKFLYEKDLSSVGCIVGEFHPGVIGDKVNLLWDHIRKTHELQVLDNQCLFYAQLRS